MQDRLGFCAVLAQRGVEIRAVIGELVEADAEATIDVAWRNWMHNDVSYQS